MRFDTSQHMKLGQQMKLAPRMIQSMEILQMPLAELEERIEQELESNPTLELVERTAPRETQPKSERERPMTVDEGSAREDFERLDSYERANPEAAANEYSASAASRFDLDGPGTRRSRRDERDAKMDAMASAPARSASLDEQLREQWALAEVREVLRPLGVLIISFLDEDGFLRTPLETIADRAPSDWRPGAGPADRPSVEDLGLALSALQMSLEPPGVAARDWRECLLLQLDAIERERPADSGPDEALEAARVLVEDHLEDLKQNRLPRIAEATGMTLEEIKAGVERLRRLSLAPARRLIEDRPEPITPDAIIEYDEDRDRYFAYLDDSRLPSVRINERYAAMSRDRALEKRDRQFIRTNLGNAQWLIDAIEQRRHTLLRVIEVVAEAQRDFLDYGPQALRPLPMTQVAERLGIHVATVSRAVADKHVMTPHGVFPLRRFFTGGLPTESGEEMSYDAVRAALREAIDAEDKRKPLSDEALVKALGERGIEIARRTVAKYRDQLKIPPARLRKQF